MQFDPSQRYLSTSLPDFLKSLDEAIFEVDEYIYCVQADLEDELEDLTTSLEQIITYLKQLRADTADGKHAFSNGKDLDYMPLVNKLKHVLPFHAPLNGINTSHHRGAKF